MLSGGSFFSVNVRRLNILMKAFLLTGPGAFAPGNGGVTSLCLMKWMILLPLSLLMVLDVDPLDNILSQCLINSVRCAILNKK